MHNLLALLAAMVLAFGCAVPVSAATDVGTTYDMPAEAVSDVAEDATGAALIPASTNSVVRDWKVGGPQFTKIIGTEVHNKTVWIDIHDSTGANPTAYEPSKYRMDIMVYGDDSQGLIWSQDDWTGNNSYNHFWIGTDVTAVYVRIVPRSGLFPAPQKTFNVRVTY